jgi:hypothetical protein
MKRLIILVLLVSLISACATGIHRAVGYQDYKEVKAYIEKGTDINSVDGYGNTPLIMATYYGSYPIAKYLCEQGADVNRQNKEGTTALIYAAYYGHLNITKLLLDHGATTSPVDKYGYNARHYAERYYREDIVRLLNIKEGKPASKVLSARLYSADGQVFSVNFSETSDGQGIVQGELFGGELFRGEYFTILTRDFKSSFLDTPWGPIQLGFSITEAGPQVTRTTAVGNKGTMIRCVSFPRGEHGTGSCRDSNGRSYQLHY